KAQVLLDQMGSIFGHSLSIHELVRQVREGNSAPWGDASREMHAVTLGHNNATDASRQMLQALESSWSGDGADAAAKAIKVGEKANQAAGETYQRNAEYMTTNASAFDNVKGSLPDVPAQEPETGFWDSVAPWETDAEADARRYKAQVDQAREIYSGYESNVVQAAYDMEGDFGQLGKSGGDFGSIERDPASMVKDAGTGVIDIDEPRGGSGGGPVGGGPVGSGGPVSGGGPVGVSGGPSGGPSGGSSGGSSVGYSSPGFVGTAPNDTTGTSEYSAPD